MFKWFWAIFSLGAPVYSEKLFVIFWLFRILRNSGLTGEGILAIFPFNSKFFDVPPDAACG